MTSAEVTKILLAEDNPADVYLVREAFGPFPAVEIDVVSDGEQALDYLFQRHQFDTAPRPNLLLLDLNLPKIDGSEVLQAIRTTPELQDIPVMILTSSDSPRDRALAEVMGVDLYLTKPTDLDKFMALGGVIVNQYAGRHDAASASASSRTLPS